MVEQGQSGSSGVLRLPGALCADERCATSTDECPKCFTVALKCGHELRHPGAHKHTLLAHQKH
eukprot:7376074-Alexandrium_andersonii.AAC.1